VIVAADSLGCIAQDTFLIENITSVDETNLLNKLKIFPNPASGMISVEVAPGLQDKIGFTFFDAVGRQVFPRRLEQANYRVFGFDVSEVPPGLLVVKVSANDREIYLGRVLINR
jgi:hypothetical protein